MEAVSNERQRPTSCHDWGSVCRFAALTPTLSLWEREMLGAALWFPLPLGKGRGEGEFVLRLPVFHEF